MPSTDDRRVVLVELTEEDIRLREHYAEVSREMTEFCYDGFSAKEIEGYLERILANITNADPMTLDMGRTIAELVWESFRNPELMRKGRPEVCVKKRPGRVSLPCAENASTGPQGLSYA